MYLHMLVIEVYNLFSFSYDDMNCQYITVFKYSKWIKNYTHWVILCSRKLWKKKQTLFWDWFLNKTPPNLDFNFFRTQHFLLGLVFIDFLDFTAQMLLTHCLMLSGYTRKLEWSKTRVFYIFLCLFCGKLQNGTKYFLYQNKDFPIVLAVIELSKNMAITVVKKLVPMVSVVKTEKCNFKLW